MSGVLTIGYCHRKIVYLQKPTFCADNETSGCHLPESWVAFSYIAFRFLLTFYPCVTKLKENANKETKNEIGFIDTKF